MFRAGSLATLYILMAGCTSFGTGAFNYVSDEQIPSNIRAQVQKERDTFLAAVREGNKEAIISCLMGGAKAQVNEMGVDQVISLTKEQIEPAVMSVEEEHYIRGKSAGVYNPVLVVRKPEAHTLVLPPLSDQAYFTLLAFEQGYRRTAVGLLFATEGAAWKISTIWVGGSFSVGGKKAQAWLEDAQALSSKGEVIPAILRMTAGAKCLRPIPVAQYEHEKEFQDFGRALKSRVDKQYPMPMVLSEVPSSPKLLGLDVSFGENLLVPMINVLTTTPLADRDGLEKEASSIDKALPDRLPGVCTGTHIYMLRAYNEMPSDPKKNYAVYGLERKCRD